MGTKYQRPSGAFTGSSSLTNRTKYQNDASATPKVAISSAKIDGDFNYVVDALNELDEAAGTRSSINDRLNVVMNADGTLKATVVASVDEWVDDSAAASLTRIDNNTLTLSNDRTGVYTIGRRVRIMIASSNVYANVLASNFAGGVTTLTLTDIVDANGNANTITASPSSMAYGMMTTGATGNDPSIVARYTLRQEQPILRLKDTTSGGSEFALISKNGQLDIAENTGSEIIPAWTTRSSVTGSGLELADFSIGVAKMESNGSGRLLSWNAGGFPVSVNAGSAGQVLTSAGGSGAPSFSDILPSGMLMPFAASATSVPSGWLLCDGSAVSRSAYAALFSAVGETYGAGDSSSTFNLPDLRGRTLFGLDNMGGSDAGRLSSSNNLGFTGGSQTASGNTDSHVLTESQIPAHSHTVTLNKDFSGSGTPALENGSLYAAETYTSSSTGGGEGHSHGLSAVEVLPPYMLINYLIKA